MISTQISIFICSLDTEKIIILMQTSLLIFEMIGFLYIRKIEKNI